MRNIVNHSSLPLLFASRRLCDIGSRASELVILDLVLVFPIPQHELLLE